MCIGGGAALLGEVDGIIGFLHNLSLGVGPKPQDVESYNDFYRMVVKRSEHFCVVDAPSPPPAAAAALALTKSPQPKRLTGRLALNHMYQRIAGPDGSTANCLTMTLETLRPFKTFAWLLDDSQREEVQKWIAQVCLNAEGGDQTGASSSICDALALPNTALRSSSSAASTDAPRTKAAQKVEQKKNADIQANMLKFFQGNAPGTT